jgi:lysozyme
MALMKVSEKGLDLIKQFEGFRDYVYMCPAGKPTIGYGHVIDQKLVALTKAAPRMTREKAEQLLKDDVKEAENAINSSVKVNISQGQFDALVSLIYNWGAYNFKISNGLRKLNAGDYGGAADEFFSKVRGVVNIDSEFSNGLYKRRKAELELWQS